jgi:hypothetical protein
LQEWIQNGLNDFLCILSKNGIKAINIPTSEPAVFESLVFGESVAHLIENGYSLVNEVLDLNRVNSLPYRRVTQGSQIGESVKIQEIVNWVTPITVLRKKDRTLSFFRQGSPMLRSRERPDLLLYNYEFIIEKSESKLMGPTIKVNWLGKTSGYKIFSTLCDTNGPICRIENGDPIQPQIGVEVSLNKSTHRLEEQFKLLSNMHCKHIYAVLSHKINVLAKKVPRNSEIFSEVTTNLSKTVSSFEFIG